MRAYSFMVVQVPAGKADLVFGSAKKAGSFGGTIGMGKYIGPNRLAAALGFGISDVELLYIVMADENEREVTTAVKTTIDNYRLKNSFMVSMELNDVVRMGETDTGDKTMENKNTHELITVILNKGYAEDAMAAARRAGAGGGTILNARGTAKEDDAKFFGVHIVPEKEMLMILVPTEKKDAVLNAIKNLKCLSEPGSGITFTSSAKDFYVLGK